MSTKLHSGYRLAAGTDPFAFIKSARAALDPVRDQLDARLVAQMVTTKIDAAALAGDLTQRRHPADVVLDWAREQKKLPDTSYEKDPNRLEVAFGLDAVTNRYGAYLYCETAELTAAFEALPEVEEYGYWNNTDQPAGVTDEEWAERRRFWDHVMPDDGVPVNTMLSWSLRPSADLGAMWMASRKSPAIVEQVPTREERARQIAANAVVGAWLEAHDTDVVPHLWRLTRTSSYPEVVAAAEHLVVDLDADTFFSTDPVAVPDSDIHRAAVHELAAKAAESDSSSSA